MFEICFFDGTNCNISYECLQKVAPALVFVDGIACYNPNHLNHAKHKLDELDQQTVSTVLSIGLGRADRWPKHIEFYPLKILTAMHRVGVTAILDTRFQTALMNNFQEEIC